MLVASGIDGGSADGYRSIVDPSENFRKPGPGMLKLAIDNHPSDRILYVGDRPEDEGAAAAAGIPFKWAHEFLGE
ncbi:HAD hydrolase-like protein [Phormidesmis sp. 146-12]